MKRILTWTFCLTKRLFLNPLLIFLLAAIPLLVWVSSTIPALSDAPDYRVGLFLEDLDEVACDIANRMQTTRSAFHYEEYKDLDAMQNAVYRNELICGIVIPKNLSNEANPTFLLYVSPASFMDNAAGELVYSQFLRRHGLSMMKDYVISSQQFTQEEMPSVLAKLTEFYHHYTDSNETFRVTYSSYHNGEYTYLGQSNESDEPTNNFPVSTAPEGSDTPMAMTLPLRGTLSILIFLAAMIGGYTYLSDMNKGVFVAFFKRERILSHILYIVLPTLFFALSALLTLIVHKDCENIGAELAGMGIYLLVLLVYVYVLTLILRQAKRFLSIIPVLLLASLILCPVFIDLADYLPILGYVNKILPPTVYLSFF